MYNPTAAALPLEGLELIYVTASGGTITRKARWAARRAARRARVRTCWSPTRRASTRPSAT